MASSPYQKHHIELCESKKHDRNFLFLCDIYPLFLLTIGNHIKRKMVTVHDMKSLPRSHSRRIPSVFPIAYADVLKEFFGRKGEIWWNVRGLGPPPLAPLTFFETTFDQVKNPRYVDFGQNHPIPTTFDRGSSRFRSIFKGGVNLK